MVEKLDYDEFIKETQIKYKKALQKCDLTEAQADMACAVWGNNNFTPGRFGDLYLHYLYEERVKAALRLLRFIKKDTDRLDLEYVIESHFWLNEVVHFWEANNYKKISLISISYENISGYYIVDDWSEIAKEEEEDIDDDGAFNNIYLVHVNDSLDELNIRTILAEKWSYLYNEIILAIKGKGEI